MLRCCLQFRPVVLIIIHHTIFFICFPSPLLQFGHAAFVYSWDCREKTLLVQIFSETFSWLLCYYLIICCSLSLIRTFNSLGLSQWRQQTVAQTEVFYIGLTCQWDIKQPFKVAKKDHWNFNPKCNENESSMKIPWLGSYVKEIM